MNENREQIERADAAPPSAEQGVAMPGEQRPRTDDETADTGPPQGAEASNGKRAVAEPPTLAEPAPDAGPASSAAAGESGHSAETAPHLASSDAPDASAAPEGKASGSHPAAAPEALAIGGADESSATGGDVVPADGENPARAADTDTPTESTSGAADTAADTATDTPTDDAASDDAGAASDAGQAEGKPKPDRAVSKVRRARAASLYRTFRTRRPIEGKIEKVIKGGYEIRLGRVRGFCPHSQIDLVRVSDPESLVGRSELFRITQLRRGGDDVVVSRRVLLEEERVEEAKAVRATLVEGSVMQGHVAGLAPFGAFVDLGAGVMGLVHVSELVHGRAPRVEEVVKVGETVNVKILKVDERRNRISLSLRQAQKDPWQGVTERYRTGQVHPGTVSRLADFGAFVAFEPGLEALAPVSEMPPTRSDWQEGFAPGTERNWLVLSVDPSQRRISVVPAPAEGAATVEPAAGATLVGRVQRVEKFGVFVWLGPGQVGLMPAALSGTPRGSDLTRRFAPTDEVEVEVLEIDEGARRIRLARKGARPERPERGAAGEADSRRRAGPRRGAREREPRPDGPTQTATVDTPFGSLLADKLRAALESDRR